MLFIIGRQRQGHTRIYRVFDTETVLYKDMTEKEIIKKGLEIENAEVVDGRLKGTNGDLQRYGEINSSEAMVIIEFYAIDGPFQYYKVAFTNGKPFIISNKELEKFLRENPSLTIANGKIKTTKTGRISIGAIKGSFTTRGLEQRIEVVPKGLEKKIRQKMSENDKEGLNVVIADFITPITGSIRFYFWKKTKDKLALRDIAGDNMMKKYTASFINMVREKIEERQGQEIEGIVVLYYKPESN